MVWALDLKLEDTTIFAADELQLFHVLTVEGALLNQLRFNVFTYEMGKTTYSCYHIRIT